MPSVFVETVLPSAGVLLIVCLFVVLFLQTANVGWLLDKAERRVMARGMSPSSEESAAPHIVRSYTVMVSKELTRSLNSQELTSKPKLAEDEMTFVCGGRVAHGAGRYLQTAWLALERTAQSDALYTAAFSGSLRFAQLGGATCILHAVDPSAATGTQDGDLLNLAASVMDGAVVRTSAVRLFVVAAAFEAEPQTRSSQLCSAAIMPVSSNFALLLGILTAGAKLMQIWAWGAPT
jgi:hypothetical protein